MEDEDDEVALHLSLSGDLMLLSFWDVLHGHVVVDGGRVVGERIVGVMFFLFSLLRMEVEKYLLVNLFYFSVSLGRYLIWDAKRKFQIELKISTGKLNKSGQNFLFGGQ